MKTNIIHFCVSIWVCFVCITLVHAKDLSRIHVTGKDNPLEVGQNDTINIEQSYGEQKGINQFLKFDAFDIDKGQTAHFIRNEADTHLQNVISRVFGSKASNIDGTIQSDFPNFYILNPAGIIFGPHASLNIPGSFHASTAHYIRGNDAETKFGMNAESNVFMDHPAAFGFINSADFGSIEIQGLGEYDPIGEYDPELFTPGLSVEAGQTISLIGGDIEFEQGDYYYDDTDKLINPETLYANAGRINLVSVKSAHEVPLQHIFKVDSIDDISGAHSGDVAIVSNNDQVETYQYNENNDWVPTSDLTTIPGVKIGEINSQAEFGRIMANDRTRLAVDKFTQAPDPNFDYQSRSGEIFIKGGQILLDRTNILSQNCSDEQGGNIEIYGENINLENNTFITTVVAQDRKSVKINDPVTGEQQAATETIMYNRKGNGGHIIMRGNSGNYSESIRLYGSIIESGTNSLNPQSNSGNIDIKARNLTLFSYDQTSDNTTVTSSIKSDANGYGQGGNITCDVLESMNILAGSKIFANALNKDENAGNAGTIDIKARTIIITDLNSEISSQTVGPGEGGYIKLVAYDAITVNDFASIRAENGVNSASSIDNGNAGDIYLEAPVISLLKGAKIESSTYVKVKDKNKGRAGNITLRATDLIRISGAYVENADASSIRNRSLNTDPDAAYGGQVKLYANTIKFEDGAFIGSETFGGGNGGDVLLDATDSIQFSGTESAGYACKIYTTSSKPDGTPDEVGKAGNITLIAGNLIQLKDGAGVTASTMGPGEGGSVVVEDAKKLEILGGNPHGENEDGFASGLFARAEGQGSIAGSAQKIDVSAVDEVIIKDGGVISTSTLGAGDAGEINLNLGSKLSISGKAEIVSEDKYKQSQNNYSRMYSVKGDYRSGIYSSSENAESYAGDAGKISIIVNSLSLDDFATISTSSKGKGKAGDIDIERVGEISIMNGATISSATFSQSNELPNDLINYVRGGDIKLSNLTIYYNQSDLSTINNPQKGDIANCSDKYFYYNGNIWVDFEMEKNILNVLNQPDLFDNLETGDICKFKQLTISYKKFNGTSWEPCNLNEISDIQTLYSVSDIDTISDPNEGDIAKESILSELNDNYFKYDGTSWHADHASNQSPDKVLSVYYVSALSELTDFDNGDMAIMSDGYYYFHDSWKQLNSTSTNVLSILNQTNIFENLATNDIYKYEIRDGNNPAETNNAHFIYNGEQWYEFDRDTLPMYQFRIFTVDDPNEIIPEKGDIVKIRNTDQYKYFYRTWHDLKEGDLSSEEIPQLLKMKGVFDRHYFKGDRANFVKIDENKTLSYTYNGDDWVTYTVDDFSNYLDQSKIDFDPQKNKFNLVQDRSRYEMDYFFQEDWVRSQQAGNAGTIKIDTNATLNMSGVDTSINTATYGAGNAGLIEIDSQTIHLSDFCEISSASHSKGAGGDAGTIKIMDSGTDQADYSDIENWSQALDINTNAKISTSTEGYGDAGNIEILSSHISIKSESSIASSSNALGESGDAGNIIIHSKSLSLIHENTSVNTSTYGRGDAGNIDLLVQNLNLDQKASISSASNSIGRGGDAGVIRIGMAYQDNTDLSTKADKPWHITKPSDRIRVINGSSISTASAGAGKAGIVLLGANNIDVHQSASISSANSSVADIIYFKDKVEQIENLTDRIGAVVEVADDGQGNPKTYIYTGKGDNYGWEEKTKLSLNRVANIIELNSLNVDPGDVAKVADAGDGYSKNFVFDGTDWQPIDSEKTVQVYIRKTTNDLSPNIDDIVSAEKGDILYATSTSSYYICENNTWNPIQKPSVSKDFQIDSNGPITKKEDIPETLISKGDRVNEDIPETLISKGDRVNENDSNYFVRINNTWEGVYKSGNAGNINIIAEDEVSLQNNGSLNTEAISSGGGKISIEGKDTLYLFQGLITASVQKGFGAGGDINTRSNSVLMNHSGIEANAVEGDGGAIFIKTEQYIKSHDSYVTATSERGNDGTVKIDAPQVDISKGLVVLPANFLDATRWVKTPCALRSGESVSRLVLEGRDAIPTSLIDWQPSPPLDVTDIKKSEKKKKSSKRNHPSLLKSKRNLKKDLTLN
jgi:filamentous hemagglutinin family protein